MLYDYSGFPPESYRLAYPCAGAPALAEAIAARLQAAGVGARLDPGRGFDHGLFVPLKILFPQEDIPCVPRSLLCSLDPQEHLPLGRLMRGLDQPELLMIGSGFSFHNIGEFFRAASPEARGKNRAFEDWLLETCTSELSTETVLPLEEHLLPLHGYYSLTQTACPAPFQLTILGQRSSMYFWP
jgi:aromatic ring-opening dioxygenase catalytic subunit (LigB family)